MSAWPIETRWFIRRALALALISMSGVSSVGAQVPGGPRPAPSPGSSAAPTHRPPSSEPPSSARPPASGQPSLSTLGDTGRRVSPPPPPAQPPLSPTTPPDRHPNASERPPIGAEPNPGADAPFIPAEVILVWPADTVVGTTELTLRARLPASAINRQSLGSLGLTMWRLRFESEARALDYVQWVRLNWPKVLVDRNWRYEAQAAPRQYRLQQVGLDCPDTTPARASPIRIALLDTAVAPIEALRQTSIVQRDFVHDAMAASAHHGTAVAAAMTGQLDSPRFCSPATGASLVVAAVMSRSAQGKPQTHTGTVLPALDWVLQQRPHLMNLSLGGPGDALLRSVIARIVAMGLPVIAAAGQPGHRASPLYPAAYPGVIAVTALDASDQLHAQASRGEHILIGAPGVDVWLPSIDGGRYESGTSFAAPMVTATLARGLADGRLRAEDAAGWLCRHARDLGAPGRDPIHGCGALRWPASNASP